VSKLGSQLLLAVNGHGYSSHVRLLMDYL